MNRDGIDILGKLIEGSGISPNLNYYGTFHGSGHILISLCHDPDRKYEEDMGVMGDTSTSVRDPIFFEWHEHINDLCVKLKDKMQPYTDAELACNGVCIKKCCIVDGNNEEASELITFWQKSTVNLEYGLDYEAEKTPRTLEFTHLNYQSFTYS